MTTQEKLTWMLGILAALMHAAGYVLYNIQTKRRTSEPNIITWGAGTINAVLNVGTFKEVTGLPQALQGFVGTVGSITTFVWNVWTCRFEKTDQVKRRAQILTQFKGLLSWNFALCLTAIVAWRVFESASFANLIVLFAVLLAIIPVYRKAYANPRTEYPTAWIIWSSAYAVNLTNNILGWNGNWVSVVNPAVFILMHLAVAILCSDRRRHQLSPTSR